MWKEHLSLTEDEVERISLLINQGGYLGIELDRLNSLGIWITTRAEKSYPQILKKKLKTKCPVILYGAGNINLLNTKRIAIIGSRNIDEQGIVFTQKLAEKCALDGLTVVSGGARGVDSIAQKTAISKEGTVIAVLSDSMESFIKSKDNREAIMKKNMLVLSPFHPKTTFKVYNAMERNKYIYSLSQFAVAISSDYNKGGTWAGAVENIKQKWVPLFVRKDSNIPKGNEELIKLGGVPIQADILDNNNIKIDDWMSNSEIKEEIIEQMDFMSICKPIKKEVEEIKDQVKIDIELNIEDRQNELHQNIELEDNIDIRSANEILLPFLKANLSSLKTVDELASIFNVRKVQMQDWIKRMIEDDIITKIGKPAKYIVK